MPLVELLPQPPALRIDIKYASADNFMGRVVYDRPICLLHRLAAERLAVARAAAVAQGLGMLVLDAYRPPEAQWRLWEICPDTRFVAHPAIGSNHSRGVAVDLTLFRLADGAELDMGTPFDTLDPRSFHSCRTLPAEALANRSRLLGIMIAAGFVHHPNEWWHYQLPAANAFPLVPDGAAGAPRLMAEARCDTAANSDTLTG